jgi:maleate cis-trans isomerase
LKSSITDYTLVSKKINYKIEQHLENKGFAGIHPKSMTFLRDQEVGGSNPLSPTIII